MSDSETPTPRQGAPDRIEQMEALLRMVRSNPKAAHDLDFGAAIDQVLALQAADRVLIARADAVNAASHLSLMMKRLQSLDPEYVRLVSFFVNSTAARLRLASGLDANDPPGG